jgi:hypothetical protein
MKLGSNPGKWLRKKAKRGARGYPIGTVAFYGPDDRRASKLVAAIVVSEDAEGDPMLKWFADGHDLRDDEGVLAEVAAFFKENGMTNIAMPDRIIGCPHEEGKDYPSGGACPQCPFWAGRNRWTGEIEH